MNITRENIDDLNCTVRIKIEKSDYDERVTKVLKDYKKKARIDGFRPGMVPFGLVNKLYRKPVLVEEMNKLLSESLNNFIIEEKLSIIGEPLPNRDFKTEMDWDRETGFEFAFDLGLLPELDITVSAKDKLPWYKIKIDDKMRSEFSDSLTSRLGSYQSVEAVDEDAYLTVNITELSDDGSDAEEGLSVENGSIGLRLIKDEETVKNLIGLKKGDETVIDIKKAFPNQTDLAALLETDKVRLETTGNNFRIAIVDIKSFKKADINQEFYDRAFGEGTVTDETSYNEKLDELINQNLESESRFKFSIDAREYFTGKFKKDLPEEFLKRWLLEINEGKFTYEDIEKDFDKFISDMKWRLVKNKIFSDNEMNITEDEIKELIFNQFRGQFAQYYGSANIPDQLIEPYVLESFKNEKERQKFVEMKSEEKVLILIRSTVKIDEKEISMEKFNKMLEK